MNDEYQDSNNQDFISENGNRKDVNLVKHTNTIDKLVIQTKNLQKELQAAELEIEQLNYRLRDSSIRISKNLFYIVIAVLCYLFYSGNAHLTTLNNKMIEVGVVMHDNKVLMEKIIENSNEAKK